MFLLTLFSFFFWLKSFFMPRPTKNPFVRNLPTDVLSYNLCKREKPVCSWSLFNKPKTVYFALNVFPGIFPPSSSTNLSEAQKKMMGWFVPALRLTPGMRILDVGCFSPALISYLSQNYDVYIDGLTSSPSRYELCSSLGLKRCNFYLGDYDEFSSPLPYHRIYCSTPFISQSKEFLQKTRSHLLDGGHFLFFLLQGQSPHSWLNVELGLKKPSMSLEQLNREGLFLSFLEDLTPDYDITLLTKSYACQNKLGQYTLAVLSGCLRARKMLLYQCSLRREEV